MILSLSKKVFRAGTSSILLNVVNMLIGLGLAPFVVHSLGDVQNGYWVIARMIFGYYGFVDFGVGISIARFLSLSVGKNDQEESKKIIKTGLSFILLIDVVCLLLCFVAYIGVSHLNFEGNMDLVRDLVLILGLSILVILPGRIFAGVLTAHVRQDIIAWVGILNTFIRAILIVVFLSLGFGVKTLALISGVVALLTSVLYYISARCFILDFELYPLAFDRHIFSSLFKYGFSISLASVGDIVRWGAAPLIAGFFFGAAFVTHFNVALSLGRYGVALIASAFAVLMPVFGQLIGTGDDETVKMIFYQALNLTAMVSVFVFGGFIVLGNDFIGNWMGLDYQDAYPALVLMSCGLMVALMQNPIITLMQGMGLAKVYAITNGIEAGFNVILCFVLGKYGMVGFGLAFGIPMVIIKLFVQPIAIFSRVEWDVKEFYKNIATCFAGCFVAGLVAFGVVSFINISNGWYSFFINGAIYFLVYGTVVVLLALKSGKMANFKKKMVSIISGFSK